MPVEWELRLKVLKPEVHVLGPPFHVDVAYVQPVRAPVLRTWKKVHHNHVSACQTSQEDTCHIYARACGNSRPNKVHTLRHACAPHGLISPLGPRVMCAPMLPMATSCDQWHAAIHGMHVHGGSRRHAAAQAIAAQ